MVAVLLIGSGCAKENKPVLDPLLERWTEQGPVRGKLSEPGAIAWLGVPFADVTERWTLPKLPRPRTEPLAATNFREPPLQLAGDSLSKPVVGSEDWLYVDFYAPVGAGPDESLPVMFWIYGGGPNERIVPSLRCVKTGCGKWSGRHRDQLPSRPVRMVSPSFHHS